MWVQMTHRSEGNPDLVADFPASAVELWRVRGWVPTSELPQPTTESTSDSDSTPPGAAADKPPKSAKRGDTQE